MMRIKLNIRKEYSPDEHETVVAGPQFTHLFLPLIDRQIPKFMTLASISSGLHCKQTLRPFVGISSGHESRLLTDVRFAWS